jgi:hypothetical protein
MLRHLRRWILLSVRQPETPVPVPVPVPVLLCCCALASVSAGVVLLTWPVVVGGVCWNASCRACMAGDCVA